MGSSWITTVVILFGVLVAVIGVFAYLRMYKNSAWAPSRSGDQMEPLSVFPPEEENTDTESTLADRKRS